MSFFGNNTLPSFSQIPPEKNSTQKLQAVSYTYFIPLFSLTLQGKDVLISIFSQEQHQEQKELCCLLLWLQLEKFIWLLSDSQCAQSRTQSPQQYRHDAFWLILGPFMLFPGSAEAFWPAWEHWYYRHLYNNDNNNNDNIGSPGLYPGHPAFTPSQSKPRIRFGSFLLQFSWRLSKNVDSKQARANNSHLPRCYTDISC